IYNSLYFQLRDINNELDVENKIKNLKSDIGDYFSEKTLTYYAIKQIYPNNKTQATDEYLNKRFGVDGVPDYYLRQGKNILLFESKDFLINADEQMSYDYDVYKKVFYERLCRKSSGKKSAILQLIDNIKEILNNDFEFERYKNVREINIFPILVTHDSQYEVPGFNHLLNNWFLKELENMRQEGYFVGKTSRLIVIDIDTLLLYQGMLKELKLHKVIIDYLKTFDKKMPHFVSNTHSFLEQKKQNQYIPFSYFLKDYVSRNSSFKPPAILYEIGDVLIDS
ncbi:MAG: hypothetical protein PF448_13540, partial [Bacteroidales bacterium]|nr:hypothetical protein [Bacteroidales bacterium]